MTRPDKNHHANPSQRPTVIIFAGPNGSGKSTFTSDILSNPDFAGTLYINADEIAKSLESSVPHYSERHIKAAEIADARRMAMLHTRQEFAFETTMSTPEKVAFITQAKANGYTVAMYFVSTSDPEINVARVIGRVAAGGHFVQPEDVRRRYVSTMALLPAAFEHADLISVNDNSTHGGAILRVASKHRAVEQWTATDLSWVQQSLRAPYMHRKASRRHCVLAAGANVSDAEARHGLDYTGRILRVTAHHVLQLVDGDFWLHDRQLCANGEIYLHEKQTIRYRYRHGKISYSEATSGRQPA